MKEITITAYEAKCTNCGDSFSYPLLSDFAYGEFIFCSKNGQIYAHCNAFEPSARLIEVLLPNDCSSELLRYALASLADKISSEELTPDIRCSKCLSKKYIGGQKIGKMTIKRVTYDKLLALSREDIIERVKGTINRFNE